MADWIGTWRTNYFRVKDPEAFKAWAEHRDADICRKHDYPDVFCCLCDPDSDHGEIPNYDPDAPEGEDDFDLFDELADHLCDDEVAILMVIGAEKLCYLTGYAEAINNKHERKGVELRDIYKKAKKLGKNVTDCEY